MAGAASIADRFFAAADSFASPSKGQDARILEFVLQLEYMQVAFYEEALQKAGLQGSLRVFATTALGHERQHLDAVRSALGSNAGRKPRFDFGLSTRSPRAFQRSAIRLEDVAVAAYNGQATNLTPATLAAAATIVSVEARHAAWVRALADEVAAPRPVDEPMTAAQAAHALHDLGLRS